MGSGGTGRYYNFSLVDTGRTGRYYVFPLVDTGLSKCYRVFFAFSYKAHCVVSIILAFTSWLY